MPIKIFDDHEYRIERHIGLPKNISVDRKEGNALVNVTWVDTQDAAFTRMRQDREERQAFASSDFQLKRESASGRKPFASNEHGGQLRLFSQRLENDIPGQRLLFADSDQPGEKND
jgi:hypothetical protein